MTIHSHVALQTHIIQLLRGDSALSSLVTGVYDAVPQRSVFPFVHIAQWDVQAGYNMGNDGYRHVILVHIWSRARGNAEASGIAQRICALLQFEDVVVSGHRVVFVHFNNASASVMRDGATYLMALQFDAFTYFMV